VYAVFAFRPTTLKLSVVVGDAEVVTSMSLPDTTPVEGCEARIETWVGETVAVAVVPAAAGPKVTEDPCAPSDVAGDPNEMLSIVPAELVAVVVL
jgi:hypothetical protein